MVFFVFNNFENKNICFNTILYLYILFISIVVYYNLSNTNICMLLILVSYNNLIWCFQGGSAGVLSTNYTESPNDHHLHSQLNTACALVGEAESVCVCVCTSPCVFWK